ncbi:hypothetical protein AC579_5202 [Pseudocercospora musae]|uniref:Uncharacterized protein n=1 Tax=Pseudocercospora musae TaxID=113226 RepID=A0A139IDH9_9PEZI|nr:hypothetical protein AC579_5202 [Pseudocercospora musae]
MRLFFLPVPPSDSHRVPRKEGKGIDLIKHPKRPQSSSPLLLCRPISKRTQLRISSPKRSTREGKQKMSLNRRTVPRTPSG